MIPKDILKRLPWMWLSTYIVYCFSPSFDFRDLMGAGESNASLNPIILRDRHRVCAESADEGY